MSSAHRPTAPLFRVAALWLLCFSAACQPQIGDDCRRDLDCSQSRDRICDTTQQGGYCTQIGCTSTSCPKGESVCVAFNNGPSTVGGCENRGRTSPYVRNFCMRSCGSDDDCRAGYACVDAGQANPWGAQVIQLNPVQTGICIVPVSFEPSGEDRESQVCLGPGLGGAGGGGAPGGGAGGDP